MASQLSYMVSGSSVSIMYGLEYENVHHGICLEMDGGSDNRYWVKTSQ